ncbi:MAG: acyl-phosphate glycerol 3-phosphate acyltransferase [Chloroflexi bacterium RBG_13_50_10]|nr:MAG: acyl-phosphate glycerol 3-phosphate acyltransferase [Chloroflexi bacterium RBG_13_50_10]
MGAIPFALIIGKRMGGIDISKYGSGNLGGTNVLRVLGFKAGVIVMALDIAKAFVPVMLAKFIIGDSVLSIAGFPLNWQWGQVITALMVMVGHNWSVYIKFHGGKGAAAYFGGWFAIFPVAAVFGGAILIITVLLSKYMSLGSILGSLGILCFFMVLTVVDVSPPVYLIYSIVAAALIIYQHRSNISRLQAGTESKMGRGRTT